jgi:hypothetical protein
MNFQQWLRSLDSCLLAGKRGFRVTDLDPDALEKAFDDGESPAVFAQRTDLPLASTGQKVVSVPRKSPILGLGLVTLSVLITVWGVLTAIRNHQIEDFASVPKKYPVQYPVRLTWGNYTPPEGLEALTFTKEFIRSQALSPGSVIFPDEPPLKEVARGRFVISGQIEAQNDFGTQVRADYEVETLVLTRPAELQNRPLYKISVTNFRKSASGNSSVWKDANSSAPFSPSGKRNKLPNRSNDRNRDRNQQNSAIELYQGG